MQPRKVSIITINNQLLLLRCWRHLWCKWQLCCIPLLLTAQKLALEDLMKNHGVKLFAPRLRKCCIDQTTSRSTGSAKILSESSKWWRFLKHKHEAPGEEVHANRNAGCSDDDLGCILQPLQTFGHRNYIISCSLPIKDEDIAIGQLVLQLRSNSIGLLECFSQNNGREVMLLLMSLYQLCQLWYW